MQVVQGFMIVPIQSVRDPHSVNRNIAHAVPTASMIPEMEILHRESPSPVTPLGAKGVAEGNAMSTPACIANAVADALGVPEISLPLTPEHMLELLRRGSSAPTHRVSRR